MIIITSYIDICCFSLFSYCNLQIFEVFDYLLDRISDFKSSLLCLLLMDIYTILLFLIQQQFIQETLIDNEDNLKLLL